MHLGCLCGTNSFFSCIDRVIDLGLLTALASVRTEIQVSQDHEEILLRVACRFCPSVNEFLLPGLWKLLKIIDQRPGNIRKVRLKMSVNHIRGAVNAFVYHSYYLIYHFCYIFQILLMAKAILKLCIFIRLLNSLLEIHAVLVLKNLFWRIRKFGLIPLVRLPKCG